jgi:glutathione S-transferase
MLTNTPQQAIVLYDFPKSGHAHRARLMVSLLGLPVEIKQVDLLGGEQNEAPYKALNPFGNVPVLDDGGEIVWDSTAILVYLAKKYGDQSWLPTDAAGAARVQRFLSMASGEIFRGPCTARLITVFGMPFDRAASKAAANQLFEVLDEHLANRNWLAAEHRTIADVAAYSYIAHAPEGDVSLEPYHNIRRWLKNVESLPGFVPMPATAIGLATTE